MVIVFVIAGTCCVFYRKKLRLACIDWMRDTEPRKRPPVNRNARVNTWKVPRGFDVVRPGRILFTDADNIPRDRPSTPFNTDSDTVAIAVAEN